MELSDIRAVACHYMNMAAYTMWHNYSGSPEDLQAENAGLAGAIQVMHLSQCLFTSFCTELPLAFKGNTVTSNSTLTEFLSVAVGVGPRVFGGRLGIHSCVVGE